jgi:hypothetical protein
MSKQRSATLPHCQPKGRKETACDVLTIRIFKRRGSRFWQALVKCGRFRKRITTRTELKAAAEDFAKLAFRHFSRLSENPPPPDQTST